MAYDNCVVSLDLGGKIPEQKLKDAAALYEKQGMTPQAAMIRAVEDEIKMLQLQERKIVKAVRAAYEADGGDKPKKKPAKARKPKAEPAPKPEKPAMAKPETSPAQEAAEGIKPASDPFANNKIFTSEAAAKARALLKSKLGNLNSGLDPEMMQAGIMLAGAHIEAGARSFASYARAMLDDLGDGIRPFLRSFYEGVRFYPGVDGKDMSSADEIEEFLSGEQDGQSNTETDGGEALDPAPTEQGSGAESGGATGLLDSRGSEPGAAGDSKPDAAGRAGTRSGRNGSAKSDSAKAGGKRTGRTGRGAKSDGEGISGEDAGGLDLFSMPAPPAPAAPNVPAANFQITEDVRLGQGGEIEKYNDNLAAIRTLKAIEADNRRATAEEQRILARYVGWGGLKDAFPDPLSGEFKEKWKERGEALQNALTPREYAKARNTTTDAHYTSQTIVSGMWDIARRLGFRGGNALENSMGSGNFLGLMPRDLQKQTRFIGVEMDPITARLAQALYPQDTVLNAGFQKVALPDNSFDLSIGNPPFGPQSLTFQFKPEYNGFSIHNQFFLGALDALKPGAIHIAVVSRYLMDAQDSAARTEMAKRAELLGVIRLPDSAFKENARTSVVTDIVIMQKRDEAGQQVMREAFDAQRQKPHKDRDKEVIRQAQLALIPDWIKTGKVADPLGGEAMDINNYFIANPHMIAGVLERSGKMAHGNDITVRPNGDLAQQLAAAAAKLPKDVMTQEQSAIEAALERHQTMADALRISLSGQEAGSVTIETDGSLNQVIEREAPGGGFELAKRTLTPESPWSESLQQDHTGKWFKVEAVLDPATGKPAKQLVQNKITGEIKATKNNIYERVYFDSEADISAGLKLGQSKYDRLKKLVAIRDLLKEQLGLEAEDAASSILETNRKALREAYEAFTEEHGFISESGNSSLVSNMPDGALVQALEFDYRAAISKDKAKKIGEEPREASAKPAPILSERVITKYEPPTKADNPADAISIVMAESGRVDMERIADLLGKTVEQLEIDLAAMDKPLLFKDPEANEWVTRNDYLSGQVKRKLNAAKDAGLAGNVRALEEIQPEPWGAEAVTPIVGGSWIPPQVYQDFITHLTGGTARVKYSAVTNSFNVTMATSTTEKAAEWNTPGMSAVEIFDAMLNNTSMRVYTGRGDERKFNEEYTRLAALKAKQIINEFSDWIFQDGDRRNQLVDIFNEKFNTRIPRQHDGSHLFLPGKVPDAVIRMRRHQKNAIWRGISERFMLLDHAVGAGKTFTAIARAMERRRMGLSKKPAIVVPNHMVEQFTADVYRLYPGAKVLAAGKKDFEKSRRRKLFAKIATGDFDIVIIPHSSFAFIGISPETEERYLDEELKLAEAAIQEAQEEAEANGETGWKKPFGVKEAERLRDKIMARMEKIAGDKNKDRLLTFEQMGIDDMTVDEAHEFKNLFYSSRLTGVRGMGNKTGSMKAFDLYNKVRVLRDSPTGSVTFMTGTPISNSAVEMYTMMRYLAMGELKELGLENFDAWRNQFVSATTKFEPDEAGRLKEVVRLGRTWSNMRSLMELYYSFTDAVTNDDIKAAFREDNPGKEFPLPKVKGGGRQSVIVQPTQSQIDVLEQVLDGFDALPNIEDPYDRNKARLRLMDRARKVALDVRVVEPSLVGTAKEEGGKLEIVAQNAKRIYDQWSHEKGTQLIFLDRSVPKAKGDDKIIKEYDDLIAQQKRAFMESDEDALRKVDEKLEKFDASEIEELRIAQAGGWNAYQQIKDNLIAMGVPEREIRFVQEANNDEQKQALFDAVNAGEVRFLLGSTPRMGAGTNVQKRLVGLHHVDVTYKPSDIEQREGRIERQGNLIGFDEDGNVRDPNFEVEILAYATERTIDAKMWDLNATKLKMINGIRKYDGSFSMEFEDEDSVSMSELAALASGNPLLLERVKLMSEIDNLELLKRQHQRKMWGLVSSVESAENTIARQPGYIAEDKKRLVEVADVLEKLDAAVSRRSVEIEGKKYASRTEANTALKAAIEAQQKGDEDAKISLKVNGKRVSTVNTALAAVQEAFGDAQPFEMTVGEESFSQRTDASRAIADIAREMAMQMERGGSETRTVGKAFGYGVELTVGRRGWFDATLALVRADGSTFTSASTSDRETPDFNTQHMRSAVSGLFDNLDVDSIKGQIKWAEERIEKAKEELPELIKKRDAAKTFPQDQELLDKMDRLEEVVTMLSTGHAPSPRDLALKDFMAGSAVVDAKGKPLKVYHGTDTTFSQFEGLEVTGWFSEDATFAGNAYTNRDLEAANGAPDAPNIMPAYLSIKKPLVLPFDMNDEMSKREIYEAAGIKPVDAPDAWGKAWADKNLDQQGPVWENVNHSDFVRDAQAAGFDGIKVKEDGKTTWAIFKPEQAKSATGNAGTFDPTNPDILASKFDPARRRLLLGAIAAAAAPKTALAGDKLTIGRAKPINPAVLAQKVPASVEKILRNGKGSGVTNLQGAKALKAAMLELSKVGPQEIRALAKQLADTLPDKGVAVTVDDTRLMNVHGAVSFSPLVHLQLFTADGREGLSIDTVLHETLHVMVAARYRSLSVGVLRSNDKIMGMNAPAAAPAMEQFTKVWLEFKEATRDMAAKPGERLEGLKLAVNEARGDPDEFFVRALTDPLLQQWMAGQEYKGKTLWERFKGWVKETFFGGRSGTAPSWLDAALMASKDLYEAMGQDAADWKRLAKIQEVSSKRKVAGDTEHKHSKAFDTFMGKLGVEDQLREKANDFFFSAKTFNGWWHRTIGTQYHKAQVDKQFKRTYDSVQNYISSVSQMANDAADLAPSLLPKLEQIADLKKKAVSKTDLAAVGNVIFEGTLKDELYSRSELKDRFKLTDAQADLYTEFRASVDKSLDDLTLTELVRLARAGQMPDAESLMDLSVVDAATKLDKFLNTETREDVLAYLEKAAQNNWYPDERFMEWARTEPSGLAIANRFAEDYAPIENHVKRVMALTQYQRAVSQLAQQNAKLKRQGYAPLMRFGEHTVLIQDSNGETLFFGMAESGRDAKQLGRDMEETLKEDNPDLTVTYGIMPQKAHQLFQGMSPDTIELFAKAVGVEQDEAFQTYLKLVVSNRSSLKRLIHRKGTAGFSQDTTRILASFITSNARRASKNLHGMEMRQSVDAIPEIRGDVKDEASDLVKYIDNPIEEAAKMRGLLFVNFIGGSVASAAVNATQPIMMTLPYLSQFKGIGQASAILFKSMRDAATVRTDDIKDSTLRKAMQRAEAAGVVSPQEIHTLQAEAMRNSRGVHLGDKEIVSSIAMRKAALVWGSFFSLAEQFNRRATFMAAYETAKLMSPAELMEKANVRTPYEFAVKAIAETQGVYNRGNRPNWARGAIGATIFTFKQYSISYVEFLKRLPPKERALALAILVLAAGVNGLPFAEDLDDVIDTIGQALGYNMNIEKSKKIWASKVLGQTGADLVLRGATGAGGIPLDVSMRMSMGNLLPATGVFKQSETSKERQYAEILGAAGAFAQNIVDGTNKALGGNLSGALQEVVPNALGNVAKAVDMAQTGMYRDTRGRNVIEVNALDVAAKAIGFQPNKVAREQGKIGMIQQDINLANKVKQDISDQWARGLFDKDPEKVKAARETLKSWNLKNPEARIAINPEAVAKRVQEMKKTKDERIIRNAPSSMRGSVKEYLE